MGAELVPCFPGKIKTWINALCLLNIFPLKLQRFSLNRALWFVKTVLHLLSKYHRNIHGKCRTGGFMLYKNGCSSEHTSGLLRLDEPLLALEPPENRGPLLKQQNHKEMRADGNINGRSLNYYPAISSLMAPELSCVVASGQSPEETWDNLAVAEVRCIVCDGANKVRPSCRIVDIWPRSRAGILLLSHHLSSPLCNLWTVTGGVSSSSFDQCLPVI